MGSLLGRSSDGDEWDIVHDLTSFLCPPFKPLPNLAQDPAVDLSGFLFVLPLLLPLTQVPGDIFSIKIDLSKDLMLFVPFPRSCHRR